MRILFTAGVATAALLAAAPMPASAACKRMGFLVNDYGKEGPTKDAKDLLDKDIAKKMAAQGIKKYTVGKKDVKCELFLNFIVFDEHTCTAEANVCWGDSVAPAGGAQQVSATSPSSSAATPATAEKIETSSTGKAAKKATAKGDAAPSAVSAAKAETAPKAAQ